MAAFLGEFDYAPALVGRLCRAPLGAYSPELRAWHPFDGGEAKRNELDRRLRETKGVNTLVCIVKVAQNTFDRGKLDVYRNRNGMLLPEIAKIDSVLERQAHDVPRCCSVHRDICAFSVRLANSS